MCIYIRTVNLIKGQNWSGAQTLLHRLIVYFWSFTPYIHITPSTSFFQGSNAQCKGYPASEEVLIFEPHSSPINCLKFRSDDCTKLMSCSYDGTLRQGDFAKQKFTQVHIFMYLRSKVFWFPFSSDCWRAITIRMLLKTYPVALHFSRRTQLFNSCFIPFCHVCFQVSRSVLLGLTAYFIMMIWWIVFQVWNKIPFPSIFRCLPLMIVITDVIHSQTLWINQIPFYSQLLKAVWQWSIQLVGKLQYFQVYNYIVKLVFLIIVTGILRFLHN